MNYLIRTNCLPVPGIQVVSELPEYYYTQIAALKIDLIGEASKDARTRAEKIANHAGCRLSEVRNARMGVLPITRPNSTETSSQGIHDTSTIDKDVTSIVTLTLVVEPQ